MKFIVIFELINKYHLLAQRKVVETSVILVRFLILTVYSSTPEVIINAASLLFNMFNIKKYLVIFKTSLHYYGAATNVYGTIMRKMTKLFTRK
jgi:hypothetical protein